MLTANEIRQQFIDFFVQKHGHTAVPSSPVVPQDDPTLLFTNAGMNQFKDVFLGTGTRPYKRAVDSQKCIRAGGKHNDLEDVGRDTYHHTFFEMLGNWSFGDYFKKEAIAWAWELLTKVWKLDKSRLHATVFEGDPEAGLARDDEAAEFWRTQTDIDPSHIHLGSKKDNFWMMGDTGPCGPCSEIHYDRTPDKSGGKLVNKGDARVIEIWNLVFIQFNRDESGKLHPLPAKHVDTGMGFERITAVLQGKESNYDTDVFTPLFKGIEHVTKAPPYTGKLNDMRDIAYRVIADHIRALTFAIADGATPSYLGRGYVLRRILRRAERYGRQYLGTDHEFLCELVPYVIETMSKAYPELKDLPAGVFNIIEAEEHAFLRTLDRGIRLFQDSAARSHSKSSFVISGEDAFALHDTHGIYIDITQQMAQEVGMTVDLAGFQECMRRAKELSRAGQKRFTVNIIEGRIPTTDDTPKYHLQTEEAMIVGWIEDNVLHQQGRLKPGRQVALLLDRTSFYAEQGGQIGDQGKIWNDFGTFKVVDTQKLGESVLHIGSLDEESEGFEIAQEVSLSVNRVRRADIMRNHTATHLLNLALWQALEEEVVQKGSLVDSEKTRFDFSHDTALTAQEIALIEEKVNQSILANEPVYYKILPLSQAKAIDGVRAVFGEKYPETVRVVLIGTDKPDEVRVHHDAPPQYSAEFCGGTHVSKTGEIGLFKIISEEAVGKGVRRITAITGRKSLETFQHLNAVTNDLTGRFRCKPEELPARIESMQEEIKKLQQQLKKGAATDLQSVADKLLAEAPELEGSRIIVGEMPAGPEEQLRQQVDRLRQKAPSSVVVLGWADDGKVGLLAAVTEDLIKKGLHAGKLIGQVAKVVGGGGGGKPTMAQAGGKDPGKLGEALELARTLAKEKLATDERR